MTELIIPKATRFKDSLRLFGWQGGTIHQVNQEYTNVLKDLLRIPDKLKNVNIYGLNDGEFALKMYLYTKNKE